jgi:hypothetical protein
MMNVIWNDQVLMQLSNFGLTMESQYDDMSGCTSEGYKFSMAFITRAKDNPDAKWTDNFDLFFNTTANCDSGSSECMGAYFEQSDQYRPYMYNVSSSQGDEELFTLDAFQATVNPSSCNTEVKLVLQIDGNNMQYDGNNMPFIQATGSDMSYIEIQWNEETRQAATMMGAMLETVSDDEGCTSEGFKFDMAFITKVPGAPGVENVDAFTIFFNTTA